MLKIKNRYDFRREFAAELKSGRWRQVHGRSHFIDEGERVGCKKAGCILEIFAMWMDEDPAGYVYGLAKKHLGLSKRQVLKMYNKNDHGVPLPEIADWLLEQP